MHVLVTGGAGYIGSHTCLVLAAAGHQVTVLDNFANSSPRVMERLAHLARQAPHWVEGDVRDADCLGRLFASIRVDAVIHFAGLKAVGESVATPLAYYDNNVTGSLTLLDAMRQHGVRTLVFSSSATVYGDPAAVPIHEDFPLAATNPYGRTKLVVEEILGDLFRADPAWNLARLRYFNPVGAHESGMIGEDPRGTPNNLLPFIAQVAVGRRERLTVFGGDYPTSDGTGVRDYIHVMDLAEGHLAALQALAAGKGRDCPLTVNLGTGRGISVLEMVRAFEAASGKPVPYQIANRRPGDVASCYADPSRAQALLGWHARRSLAEMCQDAWRWQSMNPMGFGE